MSSGKERASTDMRAVQSSLNNLSLNNLKPMEGSASEGHTAGGDSKRASFTYNAERVLGSGSFGIVYQAQVVETGESVAIKNGVPGQALQESRASDHEGAPAPQRGGAEARLLHLG